MGHLRQSMNTCIGAPSALQFDLASHQLFRCSDERALDTAGVFLSLPTPVRCTVVFDGDLVFGHVVPLYEGQAVGHGHARHGGSEKPVGEFQQPFFLEYFELRLFLGHDIEVITALKIADINALPRP